MAVKAASKGWAFGGEYNKHSDSATKVLTTTSASTSATKDLTKGATEIDVNTTEGFAKGDIIEISSSAGTETNEIADFASIVLKYPLKYSHPVGATIKKIYDDIKEESSGVGGEKSVKKAAGGSKKKTKISETGEEVSETADELDVEISEITESDEEAKAAMATEAGRAAAAALEAKRAAKKAAEAKAKAATSGTAEDKAAAAAAAAAESAAGAAAKGAEASAAAAAAAKDAVKKAKEAVAKAAVSGTAEDKAAAATSVAAAEAAEKDAAAAAAKSAEEKAAAKKAADDAASALTPGEAIKSGPAVKGAEKGATPVEAAANATGANATAANATNPNASSSAAASGEEGKVVDPFGQEKTANQLQGHAARTQDVLVDAMENAEVAEVKRTVYRTLTRLRSAQVKEFDWIARQQVEAVDEYNDRHQYRVEHPLKYLDWPEKSIYEDKFRSFHE